MWHEADMDALIKAFVNDRMLFSPFNDHVLKFWELRRDQNLLFLHFEDMKRNLKEVTQKVAKFLRRSYSSTKLDELCEHLSFDKMKENKVANKADIVALVRKASGLENDWNFLRKGKVGSYREELTPEQIELLDFYVKLVETDGSDFRYKFE